MHNFKTYQLAINFYKRCQRVKVSNRIIRDQFSRASLSTVLNIAEGYGRATTKDRRRFYVIALGSLRETQCLLELLNNTDLLSEVNILAASLFRLCQNPGCLFPEDKMKT